MNVFGRVCRVRLMWEKMTIFWIGYGINIKLNFFFSYKIVFAIGMRQEVNASFLFLKAVIMYEYFIGIFQYHTILLSYGINDAYKTLIWWEKMSSGWNFGLFWGGGWSGLCNCLKKLRIFHWILEVWPAKCHWQDVH